MVFQQNLLEKAFSLPKCLVWPWSGRPVLTFGKRDPKYVFKLLDPNSQTSWQQSPAPLVNDIASLRSSIYGIYLGGQRQFGASTGHHQIWNNLTPLQICRLNTCLLKKWLLVILTGLILAVWGFTVVIIIISINLYLYSKSYHIYMGFLGVMWICNTA